MDVEDCIVVILTQLDSSDESACEPVSENPVLFHYPPNKVIGGSIAVRECDYLRLNDGEYLNDTLVDFYLRYLIDTIPSNKYCFYAFTSFFYNSLVEGGYEKVSKWTKNVDLFEYTHWFIPVVENEHWNLAVVCYPSACFDDRDKNITYILFFDSLEIKNSNLAKVLRDYIASEWENKGKGPKIDLGTHDINLYTPKIPTQDNSYDCGVFLLHYAELVMREPMKFHVAQFEAYHPSLLENEDWFTTEDVTQKRKDIKRIMLHLMQQGPVQDGFNVYLPISLLSEPLKRHRKRARRLLENEFSYD
jgi:sentrin-specific protease 7